MTQFFKTKKETQKWLDDMQVQNYTIHDDLTVSVDGAVYIYNNKLEFIPVQFREVTHTFDCSTNNLKNLIGSPFHVGAFFQCSYNPNLVSLEGSPEIVGKTFCAYETNLQSLAHGPKYVKYDYDFSFGAVCLDNINTVFDGALVHSPHQHQFEQYHIAKFKDLYKLNNNNEFEIKLTYPQLQAILFNISLKDKLNPDLIYPQPKKHNNSNKI